MRNKQVLQLLGGQSYFGWTADGISMKLFISLSVAALLLSVASAAPPALKKTPAQATLDFIAQEQASGAAEAASPPPQPQRPLTTASTVRLPASTGGGGSNSQQHHLHQTQQRVNASGLPKKDWELVPTRQEHGHGPTTPALAPTRPPPAYRPTTLSYAGVVKDHRHDTLPPLTTTRPRVHNIPIAVEHGYTTSTEATRWYDKLFGKGTDVDDDSPWGRRRRQAELPSGAQRSEVVIGSNAIRVKGTRPAASQQARPRPSHSAH